MKIKVDEIDFWIQLRKQSETYFNDETYATLCSSNNKTTRSLHDCKIVQNSTIFY